MKMLHVIARAFGLGAIALAVALTPACQSNEKLENQDAFKTQVDRIDRMEKDVDAMHRQMSTIDRDLQQVSTDVAKFSQQGGGDAQAAAAREQRLQQLEAGLKTANDTVADMTQRLAKLEQAGGAGRPRATSTDAGEVGKGSAVAASRKSGKVLTVRAKTEGSTQAKSRATEGRGARGVYHRMAEGETIAQVARQYQASASDIRAANDIPRGREPIVGQQLFVPAGQ
jgi:LysM repeat protein